MKRNFKVIVMTLAILATMTSCGSNIQTDNSEKTTTQVCVTTRTDVAPTDSSETDTSDNTDFTDSKSDSESKTDTANDSKSDSSSDESKSEKATTTTKTSESKNESEKAVTTTKQSSTTTSAVATRPVATRPTAKPIVTTKATQKPIVTAKQTTKATTKATIKVTQATSKSVLPSNATPLRKALYEIMCCGKNIPANFKIVQQELIKYGKSLYPQSVLNPNLHGWVDSNGKYYDTTNNGQWTFLNFADNVDFYDTWLVGYSPVNTLNDVDYFEYQLKNYVKNQLSGFRGIGNPNEGCCWYVTIGMHTSGYTAEITCICSFI